MMAIRAAQYTPKALSHSGVIKSKGGILYSFFGYNSNSSAQFIQFFDSATVPSDGEAPLFVMIIPGSSNFFISFDPTRFPFQNGISWSNSSTVDTKTIGSADVYVAGLYE